jgi:acid phosphatase
VPREASLTSVELPEGTTIVLRADRGDASAPVWQPRARQAPIRLKLVAFGDSGIGDVSQHAVARAMAAACDRIGCDLGLHTGDIIYPTGIQSPDDPQLRTHLEEPYAVLAFPVWLAFGNHDHYGNPDAWLQYAARNPTGKFRVPARYYTFQAGGVRFMALDTEKPTRDQEAWALRVLADARRNREPWIVVFGHHPRWSHGRHGHATEPLAGFLDRVLCWRADAYLAGHDHDRQVLKSQCGVHYAVSGAGAQLRPIEGGQRSLFARSALGFLHWQFDGPRLAAQMIDADGTSDFRYAVVRSERERCAPDAMCNSICAADPDCTAAAPCGSDQKCQLTCTDDPDCAAIGACTCDTAAWSCDLRTSGSLNPCGCDPACAAGRLPCSEDGVCDPLCAPGSDFDCRP